MSVLCRFGIHDWTTWIYYGTQQILDKEGDLIYDEKVYSRGCHRCEYPQWKRVRI